jgi:glycosyltransferase involved in cell wall biosynthesis
VHEPATEPPRELADFIARRTGGTVLTERSQVSKESSVTLLQEHADTSLPGLLKAHQGWAVATVAGAADSLPEVLAALQEAGLHVHFVGDWDDRRTLVLLPHPQPRNGQAPPGYRALAVMTAFNEADIIDGILDRLAGEGLEVHFIDNWSSDGTLERAEGHRAVVATERFPRRPPRHYEWKRLLRRVEEIAATAEADWVIHHDADEWRTSPWRGVPMVDALHWVEGAGYNAIDHTVVVHPPTDDGFTPDDDVTRALPYFEFGRRPGHFTQIKAWRPGSMRVDLASSGGHQAVFAGRRVFPVNFLLRHYPIRSQAHGERKVLVERQSRWSPSERRLGWHNQYDLVDGDTVFVRDPGELNLFVEATFHERFLFERLARIGIKR